MITTQQIESAKSGNPVTLCEGGVDLVLIRRDLFERSINRYDDSEWSEDELSRLAARTFEDADIAGPIE